MPCNSSGDARWAAIISRLSSRSSGMQSSAVHRNAPGLFARPKCRRHCPRGVTCTTTDQSPPPFRAAPLHQASHRAGHYRRENSIRPGTMTSQATVPATRRLLLARPHGEAVVGTTRPRANRNPRRSTMRQTQSISIAGRTRSRLGMRSLLSFLWSEDLRGRRVRPA
jgi:hypothetical protein